MNQRSLGLIGVGTMGGALALNIAEKGFSLGLYNLDADSVDSLLSSAGGLEKHLWKADSVETLVTKLQPPRAVFLMVPAGEPVDVTIAELKKHLAPGDTIIDGGNSDFRQTQERSAQLQKSGLFYLGIGVSGGEHGARHGPSMMVGGESEVWESLRPMLEAVSAKFQGQPCVAHLGTDGAGHFVKTVHNGIEYADMQMIAEIYGLMRDGKGASAQEIATLFSRWNEGDLQSYLVDITAKALTTIDPETELPLVDVILDKAGQKGTGRWTIIEAIRMGQSASVIEAAVGARAVSSKRNIRLAAASILNDKIRPQFEVSENDLESALRVGRILGYAQGFRILAAGSEEFGWDLDFAKIADIWREGCIIRSALLNDISQAFRGELPEGRLILSPGIYPKIKKHMPGLRRVVAGAISAGIPVPALSSAVSWYDEVRLGRGTTNLIQAQRDFFGAHGFQRLDKPGNHHGEWHLGQSSAV